MASYDAPDLSITNDDAAPVDRIAREMLDRYGAGAVRYLQERAEHARGIGDSLSARAWLDIAEAVQDLLLDELLRGGCKPSFTSPA
jgi:hypothetical protein